VPGGDIFTRPAEISVSQFFSVLNLDYYDIKDILNMLNNMGILSYEEPLSSDSVKLTEPRVEEKKLKLNYKRILESYISLQNKVDKMVDYVFTDGCRFQFILRYFGENTENYRCNKCDRCLNESRFSENVKEYVSEVILKTLDESKKILSENLLISILRGKGKSDGKPELSSFGVCRNYSREELKIFIRSLIEKGFVEEAKEKTRGLKITGKGLFHITGRSDQTPVDNKNNYESNLALFNLLRECRSKAAKKFNQNGLIICPDETLREFARIRPETKNEFMSVKGSNPRMFNKIGEEFLEIIRNYKEEPELSLPAERKRTIPSNIQETYTLLKKGYSLKDISQLRKTPEAIISMQIESIIEYEPDIDINHLFNLNELKKIRAEIRKGYTDLKDLKMRLDNSVTYPMLRIAVAKHKFSRSSPEVSPDAS